MLTHTHTLTCKYTHTHTHTHIRTQVARDVERLHAERHQGQEALAKLRKEQQDLASKVAASTAQLEKVCLFLYAHICVSVLCVLCACPKPKP